VFKIRLNDSANAGGWQSLILRDFKQIKGGILRVS